jgi:hypothetical protein
MVDSDWNEEPMAFKLNPDAGIVFLPGFGRVRRGDLLMGDHYRRFVPNLLVEVPDPPTEPAVEAPAPKQRPLEASESTRVPLELELGSSISTDSLLNEEEETREERKPKHRTTRSYKRKSYGR